MEADFISVLITGDYATLGATCLSAWKDIFRFRRCVGGPEGKQGSNFYPTLSVASFHQRERAPPEFIDTAGFYHYNHTGPSSSAITFSGENTLTASSSSSSLQKHSPQKENKRERQQTGKCACLLLLFWTHKTHVRRLCC